MARIKAALCREFGAPLVIEEIDLRPPRGCEVEVRIEAVAICHSDISYIDGGWGGALPAVYGHEAAGRVVACGPGARGYTPGQPVLVTLIRACGHCAACASGAPVLCSEPDAGPSPLSLPDGTPVAQGLQTGAFAQRVVVDHSQLAPLPPGIAMDAASLLSCGVITGVGAVVNAARLRPGQDAVVIGAGGVGLNAIQGARLAGARRIVAVDLEPTKLDAAREFGATDTILASDPRPLKAAAALLGGRGADAVFVTVGSVAVYETAPRYLAPGGQMVMVGMPHSGQKAGYEPVIMAALGQKLIATRMGDVVLQRDIPWLADLYQQGRLHLDTLISGRWRLDQINEAIADTRSGKARRNVVLMT